MRVDEDRFREKEGGRQKTHYTPVVEYVVDGRTYGPTSGGVSTTNGREYAVGNGEGCGGLWYNMRRPS